MKKFLTLAASAVLAVCLFALAACGGASSTLSSFVSSVKSSDFDKAAEYVVGGSLTSSYLSDLKSDDDLYNYMYDQTVGSFKYSVEETSTNEGDTTSTIKISYSGYSYTTLVGTYVVKAAAAKLTGDEITKSDIKGWVKDMTKKESTTSVVVVKDDDGNWLLEAATATALLAVMFA